MGAWLAVAARVVLGVVFLRMGLAKVEDPVAFLKLVREYELVPDALPWLLNSVAIVVPWLEVWLGALLILGVAVRGVSLTLLAMLIVFTGAIAVRGLALAEAGSQPFCDVAFDCGCGSGVVAVCAKLPENVGLMVLAGIGVATREGRACLRFAWRRV